MIEIEELRKIVRGVLDSGVHTPESLASDAKGVTAGTIRNFAKDGHSLRRGPYTALSEWATRHLQRAPIANPAAAVALTNAERITARSVVRISQIYGQLQSVLNMIHAVGAEQQDALQQLQPYLEQEEEDAETAALRAKLDRVSQQLATPPDEERRRRDGSGPQ